MKRSSVATMMMFSVFSAMAVAQVATPIANPGNTSRSFLPPWSGEMKPTRGGVGTKIMIKGDFAGLAGAYLPADVLILGEGAGGFLGRVNHLTDLAVLGEIGSVARYGAPRPITLKFGTGAVTDVPDLDGVSYPEPVWGWMAVPGQPDHTTGDPFEPLGDSIFQTCDDPDSQVALHGRLDSGCLRFTLPAPGSCPGDKISAWLSFDIDIAGIISPVAVQVPPSLALPKASWFVASKNWIEWPINFAFFGASVPCLAHFETATRELVICCTAPGGVISSAHSTSNITIAFDPATHPIYSQLEGLQDDYVGIELSSPAPDFRDWIDTYGYPHAWREYDEPGANAILRETFESFGTTAVNGRVRSARFETHINGFGEATYTDGIWLGFDRVALRIDWAIALTDLPVLGYSWLPGDDAFLCFDLSELPKSDGTTASIMHRFAGDLLDGAVQDDTTIDYFALKVRRCTHYFED